MKVTLFLFLFWPLLAQTDASQQLGKLECVEEVGVDKTPYYTTYIVMTKSTNEKDVSACAVQAQSLVNLQLLSVNHRLGLFVLRDTNN